MNVHAKVINYLLCYIELCLVRAVHHVSLKYFSKDNELLPHNIDLVGVGLSTSFLQGDVLLLYKTSETKSFQRNKLPEFEQKFKLVYLCHAKFDQVSQEEPTGVFFRKVHLDVYRVKVRIFIR